MLRATTPCTFSTSQLPKVVRTRQFLTHFTSKCASRHNAVHFSRSQLPKVVRGWGVLYLFTSKSASRHNGVQLFISHLPRCLRTRRFSEPTFQHSVSRLSYLFAHLHLLSSDLFSSDSSPCWLLFHLSILSEVWLLNFLRWLKRAFCPFA